MILERLQDVIVAQATPSGRGAIAVVRVSGPQAIRMCDQVFQGSKRLTDTGGHRLINGSIVAGDRLIDEVVAAVYRAPHSYTTEDIIEFSVHGNPLIVEELLDLLIVNGARMARPGEFTERAYLHGRIDITQAEAVLAAIDSRTREGVSAAMKQLKGELSGKFSEITSRLKQLVGLVEAQLEFPEEDIPDTSLTPALQELLSDAEGLEQAFRRGRSKRKGMSVFLVGRPNVGKSTLFNALLGEDRSIITSVPGTTRDLVVGTLRFPGGQVRLFDAAGIGPAQSLPDKVAIRRAIGAANRADFLVVILDACSGFLPEDKELLKLLRTKPGVVVWNKTDKVSKVPALPDVAGEPISISALKRENLPRLLDILKQEACSLGDTFFANRYQEDMLRNLTGKLRSALDAGYLDMQAKDLREALELFSTSDRSRITNELLEDIFSRFCVGK